MLNPTNEGGIYGVREEKRREEKSIALHRSALSKFLFINPTKPTMENSTQNHTLPALKKPRTYKPAYTICPTCQTRHYANRTAKRIDLPENVVEVIGELFGETEDRVISKLRYHRLVVIRSMVAAHLYACGWMLVEIATALRRDHSTVMYLIGKAHKRSLFNSAKYRDDFHAFTSRLAGG